MNILFSSIIAFFMIANAPTTGYNPGDEVQNFSLKNVNGKMVSLTDYKDKEGVIVVFTCNHCPYAKAYESRIMDLDKKFASKGYPVLAINPNDPVKEPSDSYESMQSRAKEMSYSFPYLFDDTQDVAKAFGANRTPHVFLLQNVNGKFKVAYIGAIDDNLDDAAAAQNKYVENAIASLKKGEKPSPEFTKAIGCTIKWKE